MNSIVNQRETENGHTVIQVTENHYTYDGVCWKNGYFSLEMRSFVQKQADCIRIYSVGELVERRDTVVLSGDLRTMEKRMKTRNILEEKWESGIENLDVDLSEVTAMDFDSLTELLKIRNRFLQAGTKVELKNIPLRIRRIMQIFRVPISGG